MILNLKKIYFLGLLLRQANDSESKCLLEHMLDAYIMCNDQKKPGVDSLIFSSKLRRLLRLVVDLDQGGGVRSTPSPTSSKTSKTQEEHGITTFGKRVQPFHKRWAATEAKIPHSDSTTSLATAVTATKQSGDETASSSTDDSDIYEPLSYLPQLAKEWLRVVVKSFYVYFDAVIDSCSRALNLDECLELASKIFTKYKYFGKCTEDLFGAKSLFSITLNAATWKAVSSLNFETKRKMSYIFNVILHFYIVYESKGFVTETLHQLRSAVENLRQFLALTSGTNFCDLFEQLYVIMLMKRISTSNELYLNLEERICKMIQGCFPNRLPVNLLQDVRYSKGLNSRFRSSYLERCDMLTSSADALSLEDVQKMWLNFELLSREGFAVTVFRPGSCKNFVGNVCAELKIFERSDFQCGLMMKEFELFFAHERMNHTARMFSTGKPPLSFVSEFGHGVLHDTKNNIKITAKISDCLVLLQFNSSLEIRGSAFNSASIQTLINKKVIYESDTDVFRVNDVIKDDVDCLWSDHDHLTSLWETSSVLEESFNKTAAIVDCAIVNIMKHEQQCTVDALVEKTIRKCAYEDDIATNSGRVFCSASFVRARCDHHINLGYIVRKDNCQLLIYNPNEGLQEGAEGECSPNVPDMSGMPAKESDSKKFAKEFIKSVNNLPESEQVGKRGTESEFVENFCKNAIIPDTHDVVQISVNTSAPVAVAPKLKTFFRNETISPNDVTLGFEKGADVGGISLSFTTNMQPTTISSDALLAELRVEMAKIAEILVLENDLIEALLLVFDWNSDKLVDGFVNDRSKTLQLIGISEGNNILDNETVSSSDNDHCPVCLNPFLSPTLDVKNCDHKCCLDCWKTYLSTKLDQDMACSTTCPIGSCKTRITTKYFYSVFENDPTMQKKYDLSLVRSFVESDRSYSWCHNPKGCSWIIRKSKDGRDEGWCTDCGWQTCFTCTYVEAHYPASCSHMSQWMDDGGYYEGMSEDAQSKHLARLIAKRCPNCQANIEKNDGCLHMKCIKCGYDFCWRCLQPWRPTHRDYYNCSSKVSKLAQSNIKFVEYNKRCQHHNKAKLFAYSIRDRLHALNCSQDPEKLQYSIDLCMKLAYCRRILAYCNVFNFYSTDSDKLNNIGLHSAVLENKTLLLQEHLGTVLLGGADIQFMVSAITEDMIARGKELMSECDSSIKSIVEFSKQGMKIAMPISKGTQLSVTEAGTILQSDENNENEVVMNARPAGMSDEDDSDNEMTENTQSEDNNQTEDEDLDSEEDVNMYSTDDEDNDMHYDSGGGGLMDFDSDDDNMIPLSGSDYSGFD